VAAWPIGECGHDRYERFATGVGEIRQTLAVRRNVAVGDEVARLWRKHAHAEFPARLRGEKIAGVDLVALEADIVSCVETWRTGSGILDDDTSKKLTQRIEDLDTAMPLLTSRVEALYFERLCQLAVVVLDS
jgi:hypothetical protein